MAKARDGFDRFKGDQEKARKLRLKHAKHDQEIIDNLPSFYTQKVFDSIPKRDIVVTRVVFGLHASKPLQELLEIYKDRDDRFRGCLVATFELKDLGITEESIINGDTEGFLNYYKKSGWDFEL